MKKFGLTVVIALIIAGFYHAYTLVGSDVVAVNPGRNLSDYKQELTKDISDTVSEKVEDKVVEVVGESEVSLDLSEDSMTGSVVSSLLFGPTRNLMTVDETSTNTNTTASDEESAPTSKTIKTEIDYKEVIEELYEDDPEFFNELLEEFLADHEQDDIGSLEAMCVELLDSQD